MNIKIISLALAVLIALVEVTGDFFIKLSGQGDKYINWKWFIPGFLIYSLTAVLWFFAVKHEKLFTAGIFFAISTVLFLVLISFFYFKESINSYEIVGIILAIISLILLGKFA
jgi:small multidrug resistance pump